MKIVVEVLVGVGGECVTVSESFNVGADVGGCSEDVSDVGVESVDLVVVGLTQFPTYVDDVVGLGRPVAGDVGALFEQVLEGHDVCWRL